MMFSPCVMCFLVVNKFKILSLSKVLVPIRKIWSYKMLTILKVLRNRLATLQLNTLATIYDVTFTVM